MTDLHTAATRPTITFERRYEAPVQDLWELWTTKEGFESWWGPEGFRVEVRQLDLRVGGALSYAMIAAGAEQIAFMESAGMPTSTETRATFGAIEPLLRLTIRHVIDFIPGVAPYNNDVTVAFAAEGTHATMMITVDAHLSEEWTQRAAAGWESQLTKLPAVLAARTK